MFNYVYSLEEECLFHSLIQLNLGEIFQSSDDELEDEVFIWWRHTDSLCITINNIINYQHLLLYVNMYIILSMKYITVSDTGSIILYVDMVQ